MAAPQKLKNEGGEHIRSPSAAKRKTYTDSEKLLVCVLYEQMKSSDRVAECLGMEGSSVRYILKANKQLRKKAEEIALALAESEAREMLSEMKERARKAVDVLLAASTSEEAIKKSNSQQLAIAMATISDKFSVIPEDANKQEVSGGVIVLAPVLQVDGDK